MPQMTFHFSSAILFHRSLPAFLLWKPLFLLRFDKILYPVPSYLMNNFSQYIGSQNLLAQDPFYSLKTSELQRAFAYMGYIHLHIPC